MRDNIKPKPRLHGSNGLVSTAEDKANAFATSLETHCLNNEQEDKDLDFIKEIEDDFKVEPVIGQLAPSTTDKVKDIIKNLSTKKDAMKYLLLTATVYLTVIVNGIFTLQYFDCGKKQR